MVGLGSLGAAGGVGTFGGYFVDLELLEKIGIVNQKGKDITYTFKSGNTEQTHQLICKGQEGQFVTLNLENDKTSWDLKAKLKCSNSSSKQDLRTSPPKLTFSNKELICKQESGSIRSPSIKCLYGNDPVSLGSSSDHSVVISLTK
ncbi:hypothetical protein MHLP_01570 [Candidatus Mycoplasma haematolamae str. Purdue]|uniref:Uncharacterized protein n=1 Tax=Mycoplasma haematolamae (strain Purdue) TaxID=1212765 RepID=I7CJ45_MYCHA|nr:hypothetical protein MHLP_01570 [Candidatus Mycoplasma haematolamae str. Purdue]